MTTSQRKIGKSFLLIALLPLLACCSVGIQQADSAQPSNGKADSPIKVLIVTAHPDDESAMAATVYKITHELGGQADLALLTNGEGGYKYSLLAESIYRLPLTNEEVGRKHLPSIRKQELMAGGKYIGLGRYFFFEQQDHEYTLDETVVLDYVWDVNRIKIRLSEIIQDGEYDYLFTLLPTPETHGHHKAAAILALETVNTLPPAKRPTVLAVSVSEITEPTKQSFDQLENHPLTKVLEKKPLFSVNRRQQFGFKNRLNYKIIVNWLIAEHKSQGTMQMYAGKGDLENFWFFQINNQEQLESSKQMFEALGRSQTGSLAPLN